MILVTSAGGKAGRAVIAALVARGIAARAFARSAAHSEALKGIGAADVAIGALDDDAALLRAMQDIDAVYHICPNASPHEVAYADAVIAAAEAAEVPRLVYHSVLHPQIETMPHHFAKMRVEEMLFSSELNFTILQPTAYMQNILGERERMTTEGLYRVPYPVETMLSLVDLDDVAAAAARVLTEDGHAFATYELVGTAPLDQNEIAATFAAALGREVRAEAESVKAWQARARIDGMDEHTVTVLTKMFVSYAGDGLKGNPNVLGWLLGRKPTTLAEFAARVAVQPKA
ncbi:NmrA family NAD(P)-binding protein [Rhodopseudomonas sp. P2A-2r]|uniref:NmrA family NAD(P)-binding protein n=1 Tax=Rhodopseudomonas sp. P2A-2r TaxID=2991972 RepID=UPI0022341892|nr:NmrA family NAD(P)-binding protein [Rhodopseudomonas sp. P2A-2r]UZE47780.1 NmrA family NAD(P)-binding protein [Rhodopseudomonas sp. P2A-2r]